jgi:hypothetical protein
MDGRIDTSFPLCVYFKSSLQMSHDKLDLLLSAHCVVKSQCRNL